jgi:hypothetical protein
MIEGAALVEVSVPHNLAAGDSSPPCPVCQRGEGGRAFLRFLHCEYPQQKHAAGLLQLRRAGVRNSAPSAACTILNT